MDVSITFDPDDEQQVQRANEILDAISDTLGDTTASSPEQDPADSQQQESTDARSDATDDDATEPELDVSLQLGTWKFKMASTLYHHTDDRLSASDVEDALNGTNWKHQNPQNISRDLKYLVDDRLAARTKVEPDSGHDHFVFWLTDKGRNAVEHVEDDPDVTTYSDVAERGLGALFNGTETDDNHTEA